VFFDGVPTPNKKKAVSEIKAESPRPPQIKSVNSQKLDSPQAPVFFYHQPYLENQCDSCHEAKFSQKLVLPDKELCFSCHDDFTKNKKFLHYPLAEDGCKDCHSPHQAPYKYLLKEAVPKICFDCHEEKDLKANPAHEGQNVCLDCHDPHASNEEKLLK